MVLMLTGQALTVGVSIGTYVNIIRNQTEKFREHAAYIEKLDREKLDRTLHEVETVRLESDIGSLKVGYVAVESRVRAIETHWRER